MEASNDVSDVVAFTILSVAAIPEIAVPSVYVALSPLFVMFVTCALPRTALEPDDVSYKHLTLPTLPLVLL